MNKELRKKLDDLIIPVVNAMGYELWGIELKPTSAGNILSVYIEAEAGVTLDDCGRISHQISGLLDVEDPINVKYNLEVSSPGLDRTLFTVDQYKRLIGKNVHVRLIASAPGERRNYVGKLVAVTDGEICVDVDGEKVDFTFDKIERTNLVPSLAKK
ncbi:MAG: hypothetical protein A2X78_00320 [Gammaproteobacteria bacterium GWE2_37_16]|nr:MAG: hypothetical protein A2X78_00320 [Gammaproteobacteria bacterium GWE2_37_16]